MTEQEIQTLLVNALETLFWVVMILYDVLDFVSIDVIDLIDHIKRETGHKLQAEDFRNVRTVADVVQAVMKISQK